ncbi:MAG: sulfurtransferase TusA family protein [Candidatus Eisenbacteria bacterium]|nr:sulfurtransferase TusA family protein [Candidatus Eisenbacteria bacterium]
MTEEKEVDLLGQVCPYPVVNLIREVLSMPSGKTARFCVDDPLALKSIPEELEEYDDLHLEVRPKDGHWEIVVTRD